MKICTKCKEDKPLDAFYNCKEAKVGRRRACKQCEAADNARWRRENKDRAAANNARWQRENKDKCAANNARWESKNKGVANARFSRRRAAKLQRTPPWADHEAISNHYLWATCMKEVMGVDVHIDHIIPLQGKLVSGLHTHENLQLLSAEANLSKSNKFEVS